MEPTTTFDIIGMAKRVERRVKGQRLAQALGGLALVSAGMARRTWAAPLLILGGAILLVRGATGRPLDETARQLLNRLRLPNTHRFGGGKRDVVDEASWQSFPASDPPGYSVGSHTIGRAG